MGREPKKMTKVFENAGQRVELEVELFPWEKLDYIDKVQKAFGLT